MAAASYLLIRQARILEAGGYFLLGDLLMGEGKILQVAPDMRASGDDPDWEVIDADGLTLLPGVIDPQVHFREPGLEHKEDLFTATCACAAGEITSFLEMPNTRPVTITQEALDDKLRRALKSP